MRGRIDGGKRERNKREIERVRERVGEREREKERETKGKEEFRQISNCILFSFPRNVEQSMKNCSILISSDSDLF